MLTEAPLVSRGPVEPDWDRQMILRELKQGRIHGYPSRVRVGRGSDEIDQPSSWAGAVTPKPPVNAKKS